MANAPKRIIVTGGAGFVGLHLVRELLRQHKGHVTVFDNFSRGKADADLAALQSEFPRTFVIVEADLTKADFPHVPADEIYHLAAINGTRYFYEKPKEILKNNILITMNLLERYMHDDVKILYSSSGEVYAALPTDLVGIPTSETCHVGFSDVYNPRWSYGFSKLAGEFFLVNYAKEGRFRYTKVRFHNIYGPRMGYEHVIPAFIKRIHDGERPFVVKNADDTRSFCYISDCVDALIGVMESPKSDGHLFNIGNPVETKIGELARTMLVSFAGWSAEDIRNNLVLGEKVDIGSTSRRCPDVSKIRDVIGWQPKVSLADGLHKTFDWYLNVLEGHEA